MDIIAMLLRGNKLSRSMAIKHFIILVLIAGLKTQTNGKRVVLVPLSAAKVYRLLDETFNRDAIPEGRVVTQGIAAATGFTLGLKKAMAAVFVYDVITANITEPDPQQPLYLTQEICFSTRVARSFEDAEAIAEAYSRLEEKGNEVHPVVRSSVYRRRQRPKRKRKGHRKNRRKAGRPQRLHDDTVNAAATNEITINPQATDAVQATAPTTKQDEAANDAVNAGTTTTNVGNRGGLESTLSTTTSTDNDKAITCIVIQKPKQ